MSPDTNLPHSDLHLARHGRTDAEAPTLVLVHGLTDSGDGWADAVARWSADWAILTLDQRGHGRSPRFTGDQLDRHPGDVMVEDLVGLLEQLPRPVVVGHSLGGAVTLAAAVRRPELVRAVVLEDPAPRWPQEAQVIASRGEEYLAGLEDSRSAPDEEELLRRRRAAHPDWPASELLPTGLAEQRMDADYLVRGDWKPTTPWPELVAALQVPALVVTGDLPEEILVGEEIERGLAEVGNPLLEVVRVAGAGHCVRRDRTEGFHAVVDPWIAGAVAAG